MHSQDILNKIFSFHIERLKNLEETNPKILILFSGTTGSGKSFLAKKIEEEFKGIRVNNDDVRNIIRDKIRPEELKNLDSQNILEKYLFFLFENLPKTNGFLIIDSSVDRKYPVVAEFAKKYRYKTFLIRIDLDREVLTEQIRQRTDRDAEPYLNDLDRHLVDHQQISSEIQPDYRITRKKFDDFYDLYKAIKAVMGRQN